LSIAKLARARKAKHQKKESFEKAASTPTADGPTIFLKNSFCTVASFPKEIEKYIDELLTYENKEIESEIQSCFNMMKYAKSRGKNRMLYAFKAKLEELKSKRIVKWFQDHTFPTGHLPMVKELLREIGFNDYVLEDQRGVPSNYAMFRWKNKPFTPRYYQQEMINKGKIAGRGVFESAVGTGKTLVMTYLIKELEVKSLIIVPSLPLLRQNRKILNLAFGKDKIATITTDFVKKNKKKLPPIRITTIQTLASLQKNGLIDKVLGDIDALYIDEIHHSGAETYTKLLPEFDDIYYRFGFTGTFLRNDSKTLDMWGFLSNRLYYYPPYKALEDGFLTPVELLVKDLPGKHHKNYQKEYDGNYCGYHVLQNEILDIIDRVGENDQILILVDRKDKSGKILHELLNQNKLDNVYISGDDKGQVIEDAITDFNEETVHRLIGSKVIGEGVDICSTVHLILANGGKSPIQLVQAIGRCVRLFPGKLKSYVYDFNFKGTNYMHKHCAQRIDIFRNHFAGEVTWL